MLAYHMRWRIDIAMHEVKLIICHPKLLHDRERSHLLDRINTESGPRLPMLVYMPYVRARFSDYLIPEDQAKLFGKASKFYLRGRANCCAKHTIISRR